MKTNFLIGGILLAAVTFVQADTNDLATTLLTTTLQRGLFEEEANHNLDSAIQAYESVASQFDKDRKLAATAIFRLGECYRKQGNTNAATAQYARIVREFSDQSPLLSLSRQNLTALGAASATPGSSAQSSAARQEQKRLLEEEIKLVEKRLEEQQKQVEVGRLPSGDLWATQREILELKRQLVGLDARSSAPGAAAEPSAPAPASSTFQENLQRAQTLVETEEVKRIQALIKDSPDLINAKDSQTGATPLHRAASAGQLVVAQFLLGAGADTEAKDQTNSGRTPLHAAAAAGHKAMVELLLSKKASVQAVDNDGGTPLHVAARYGYRSIVEVLLAHGAEVNAKASSGTTPLHLAATYGFKAVAELLLAHGADINALTANVYTGRENLRGTPLCIAAERGDLPMAGMLLSKGARVDAEDGTGRTPLSYAVQSNHGPIVNALLAAHADANAGRLDPPLAGAAYFGSIPSLQALLANGADPNANRKVDWEVRAIGATYSGGGEFTPLFLAANRHHPEAVKLLVQSKAEPNVLGPAGTAILFEALFDLPTLKALLEGGADPNMRDKDGTSALLHAVRNADQATVEVLLAHHADANLAGKGGWTPLHAVATSENKTAFAQLLLTNGADVNARDEAGATPLYYAVERNNRDMVALLLENKADPNARTKAGQTPLELAKNRPRSYAYPGFVPNSTPGVLRLQGVQAPPASTVSIADLLRQHGAQEDLPQMDRIEIRRPSADYSAVVFSKGTNDFNQFTLFELIAVHYGFISTKPDAGAAKVTFNRFMPGDPRGSYTPVRSLSFPDLDGVVIRRPTPDGRSRTAMPIKLNTLLELGDCSADPKLHWGDVVELPEADHPIAAVWQGLPHGGLGVLTNCLSRQVQLTVKGQTTNLVLVPQVLQPSELQYSSGGAEAVVPQFCLLPVLNHSGLLRASSDLSRVKVSRHDSASGQTYDLVVDCSQHMSPPDLWLRNGDKIDVPEKP